MSETNNATFRFIGDPVDPDEITTILGIEPTEAAKKGLPFPARPAHISPSNFWAVRSRIDLTLPLSDHIVDVVAQVEVRVNEVRTLIGRGLHADIHCSHFGYRVGRMDNRLMVSAEALQKAALLGVELLIDVYEEYD